MIESYDRVTTPAGAMGLYVARPDGDGPFPVVVSFHHGPGLDAGSRQAMARIAEWGYYVIAHDRYHRETEWLVIDRATATKEDQQRFVEVFMGTTDDMVARDVDALLTHVDDDPAAAEEPFGCIGYCIGGRSVIRTMAADPERFVAGVALHPSRCTTEEPDSPHRSVTAITGALYVGFGADDVTQPPADNGPFIELVEAMPGGTVEIHDGAAHGFALPGRTFHEAAADRSYEQARERFDAALGRPSPEG